MPMMTLASVAWTLLSLLSVLHSVHWRLTVLLVRGERERERERGRERRERGG